MQMLILRGGRVIPFELDQFYQWGTPVDLENFISGIKMARKFESRQNFGEHSGTLLIPAAGKGERFSRQGYLKPKPLITVCGTPMIAQSFSLSPKTEHVIIVANDPTISESLHLNRVERPNSIHRIGINRLSRGQADTCLAAEQHVNAGEILTIAACDNGCLLTDGCLDQFLNDPFVDVIVWTTSGHLHAMQHPESYGWVITDDCGNVRTVEVKKRVADPAFTSIVCGTFTFKKAKYFFDAAKSLIDKDLTVNGEFYVDSCVNECIKSGLNVVEMRVDAYFSWGTPDDLQSFEYWVKAERQFRCV